MSTKLRLNRPEIEDFWEDCIKFELTKKEKDKTKKVRQKSNSIDISSIPNINNIKNYNKRKKIYLKNHKLLKEIITTEESIPRKNKKKEEKQIKILISLYNKDITDKKRKEKELIKLREIKINKELKNCSFKPEKKYKNKSYEKKYKQNFGEKNIYERGCLFKNKYEKKIKEIKKEDLEDEENEKYPFKPTIEKKNVNQILYGNNVWEERANNFSNKIFIWRYLKARKDESIKRKRLIWSMDKTKNENCETNDNNNNSKNGIINYNKNIQRSISQKDSLLYQKSLHFSLLDFRTNNDDDNDNNNPINIVKS